MDCVQCKGWAELALFSGQPAEPLCQILAVALNSFWMGRYGEQVKERGWKMQELRAGQGGGRVRPQSKMRRQDTETQDSAMYIGLSQTTDSPESLEPLWQKGASHETSDAQPG